MTTRVERLRAARTDPNAQAFLSMIAVAEGVQHGYATDFGNTRLADLQDHPRNQHQFTQTDGKRNTTSAAGRYQFLSRTWDDVAKALNLEDFGPEAQDLGALELARRAGALDDILAGRWQEAIEKTGATWASLPSSPYPQGKRSWDFVMGQLPGAGVAPDSPSAQPSTPRPTAAVTAAGVSSPLAASLPDSVPAAAVLNDNGRVSNPAEVIRDAFAALQSEPAAMPDTADASAPAWLNSVASIQSQPMPEEAAAGSPWEDEMLIGAVNRDADLARSNAIAGFFGEPQLPSVGLPSEIDAAINRLLATV